MFRRLEKQFNARIISLLTAGTSIKTSKKSKQKQHSLRKFFKDGVNQMSKDMKKSPSFRKKTPKKKTFREKLGFKSRKPKKKTFREKLGFKN